MNNYKTFNITAIAFLLFITVVPVILKVTGVIQWEWVWVLFPMIMFGFIAGIIILTIITIILLMVKDRHMWRS